MDYVFLAIIVFINFVVSQVGVFGGYTVNGVARVYEWSDAEPAIANVLEWIWDSAGFLFELGVFSVDGVPVMVSGVFVIMNALLLYLVMRLVRGGG